MLLVASVTFSACDFYEKEINEYWSLCAVDDPDDMRLCRNLGNDSYHGVLEPVMVAFGYNGEYITLRQCSGGTEAFYSMDGTQTELYEDPVHTGPIERAEWEEAVIDNTDEWPPLTSHWKGLERRHCPPKD